MSCQPDLETWQSMKPSSWSDIKPCTARCFLTNRLQLSEIWGSHGGEDDGVLLGLRCLTYSWVHINDSEKRTLSIIRSPDDGESMFLWHAAYEFTQRHNQRKTMSNCLLTYEIPVSNYHCSRICSSPQTDLETRRHVKTENRLVLGGTHLQWVSFCNYVCSSFKKAN